MADDGHEYAFKFARQNLRKLGNRDGAMTINLRNLWFEVGDWVHCYYPLAAWDKFGSAWTGPCQVTKEIYNLVYEIQLSRKSKPKVAHVDELKMCPVYPDCEDKTRNWMTEPEVTGDDPLNSGGEEAPQEAYERQGECQILTDLDMSDTEVEDGAQAKPGREDPSLPNV